MTLNRLAGEPVDLLVNGKPIARGEVVVIDEEFGLRVTEVVAARRRPPRGAARPPSRRRGAARVPAPRRGYRAAARGHAAAREPRRAAVVRFWRKAYEDNLTGLASMVAYNLLLSIFPLALVALFVAGRVAALAGAAALGAGRPAADLPERRRSRR